MEHFQFHARGHVVDFFVCIDVEGSEEKARLLTERWISRLPPQHLEVVPALFPIFVVEQKPGRGPGGGTESPRAMARFRWGERHAQNTGLSAEDLQRHVVAANRGIIYIPRDRWVRPVGSLGSTGPRVETTVLHELGHGVNHAFARGHGLIRGLSADDFPGISPVCGGGSDPRGVVRFATEAYAIYMRLGSRMNARIIQRLHTTPAFLTLNGIDDSWEVLSASIEEEISAPFQISAAVGSRSPNLDLEGMIGRAATFAVATGAERRRHYHGVCLGAEQRTTEPDGLTIYSITLGPRLALLDERQNFRHFQHESAIEIAERLLGEWEVEHEMRVRRDDYPGLEMRVQYGETDLVFLERLLEEEGVAYCFESDSERTKMIVDDELHERAARSPKLPHVDNPNDASTHDYVTGLSLVRNLRAGRVLIRAHDFRRPQYALAGSSNDEGASDVPLERHYYRPQSFLTVGHQGGDTPVADDRGTARSDASRGERLARVRLERHRGDRDLVEFDTNAYDLGAGMVFELGDHPRPRARESKVLDPRPAPLVPPTRRVRCVRARVVCRPAISAEPPRAHPAHSRTGLGDRRRPRGAGDPYRRVWARSPEVSLGSRRSRGRTKLRVGPRLRQLGGRRLRHADASEGWSGGRGGLLGR